MQLREVPEDVTRPEVLGDLRATFSWSRLLMSNAADAGERWARLRPGANPTEPCESAPVSQGGTGDASDTCPPPCPQLEIVPEPSCPLRSPSFHPQPRWQGGGLQDGRSPPASPPHGGLGSPSMGTWLLPVSPTVPRVTQGISTLCCTGTSVMPSPSLGGFGAGHQPGSEQFKQLVP